MKIELDEKEPQQKRIMISATREDDGKTALTVGLTCAMQKAFSNIGFIKPLGFKDMVSGSVALDDDVVLVDKSCPIHCNIQDMNPVHIDPSRLEEYWTTEKQEELMTEILTSFESVSYGKELVVIEGPGHAASGSAFGASTAQLAKVFGAKVILVTSGGVSHPAAEINLNLSHFEKYGVEVLGVIFNKVKPEEKERAEKYFKGMLRSMGVSFLGAIPYREDLARPTLMQILEALDGKLLHGQAFLNKTIGKIFVGAMRAWRVMERFEDGGLFITPGDRDDLILALLALHHLGEEGGRTACAIVLTGGVTPHESIMTLLKRTSIPVIVVDDLSYEATRKIYEIKPKLSPLDTDKVREVIESIEEHVNVELILEKL